MIKTAISFALGCLLFLQLPIIPSLYWFWALLPTSLLLLFQKTRLLSFVLLGALWAFFYANNVFNDRLSPELVGQDLIIRGMVISVPEQDDRRLSFLFSPDNTSFPELPSKLKLNWYKPFYHNLHLGEKWQLTVRLKAARGMMNPGSFDYEGWLFQQQIGGTGYVRNNFNNKLLTSSPPFSVDRFRQSLVDYLSINFPDSNNLGLLQGLTTGIRHNISDKQWRVLRLSGTSHLLAISGLHIGLAAALGFFCFKWLWSRRAQNLFILASKEAGAIGGFFAALFYAAMAGFSIPSQRALIMVAILMLSLLIRRPVAISSVLALSLLIILLHDPLAILSVGLWLSFSAVAIILFISQHRFPDPRWQWAKIHTLIAFGLTPLLLLFFMQTSLIAPIANFIAVPVVSILVVPLLLLSSLFIWLFDPISNVLFQLADFIFSLLWPFLDSLASLSFSHWSRPALPLFYWLSIIIGTILLLTPRHFPAKWLGLIALLPLIFYSPNRPNKDEFWFTLLDVGQGLSAVIETKNHTLIFDTGPKFSDSFNTGTAVIKPFLQQQGIRHIDTLIVSHGDNDHIGGAIPLINDIDTSSVLSSVPELLPDATLCTSGQSWQWDGVSFAVLHPHHDDQGRENNLSCVLKVSIGEHSVLLTGDIESPAERLLVERYRSILPSTILIAPHHGSKTSSSVNFINAVSPEIVLFPVGYHNRYGFPKEEVVNRYRAKKVLFFDSAQSGAIQFKFTAHSLSQPLLWRHHAQRIWTASD